MPIENAARCFGKAQLTFPPLTKPTLKQDNPSFVQSSNKKKASKASKQHKKFDAWQQLVPREIKGVTMETRWWQQHFILSAKTQVLSQWFSTDSSPWQGAESEEEAQPSDHGNEHQQQDGMASECKSINQG